MLELFTQNEFDLNFVFWGFCLSGLFSAGGMGLWHGVEFYENEKLVGEREFLRPKVKTFEMFFLFFPLACSRFLCPVTSRPLPISFETQSGNNVFKHGGGLNCEQEN
jgi:hypothetical protein